MEQAAVIILNYNGTHFLEKFLPSVTKYSQGHRVIVVDNGSTDKSLHFLATHYPGIEVLAFEKNHGYAGGYDLALQSIKNTYSILLNSDVEVTENWIDPVIQLMESQPQVVACQPKILDYYRRGYFEHAGASGGFIDKLGYPFCRGRMLTHLEKDHGQYDDAREVFWATGACFFVKTAAYKSVGGFDTRLIAHMEEIDLCWRFHKAGYKVYCVPQSTVYHVGGGTMPVTNPHKTYLNFRNSTVVLYKNTPKQALWARVSVKIMLDLLAALVFILKRQPRNAQAVFQAVSHFLWNIQSWKRRKRSIKHDKQPKSNKYIYPGSMIVNYYLLRKRTFDKLNF